MSRSSARRGPSVEDAPPFVQVVDSKLYTGDGTPRDDPESGPSVQPKPRRQVQRKARKTRPVFVLGVLPRSAVLDLPIVEIDGSGFEDSVVYQLPNVTEADQLYKDYNQLWTSDLRDHTEFQARLARVEDTYIALLQKEYPKLMLDRRKKQNKAAGVENGSGVLSIEEGGVDTLILVFRYPPSARPRRPPSVQPSPSAPPLAPPSTPPSAPPSAPPARPSKGRRRSKHNPKPGSGSTSKPKRVVRKTPKRSRHVVRIQKPVPQTHAQRHYYDLRSRRIPKII